MKFLRRYLFTFIFALICFVLIFGWWRSTQAWTSWDAETPIGIFKVQSESSLVGVGAQFMKHEHRWMAFKNSDVITGDKMKFLPRPPELRIGGGLYMLVAPYWQLLLAMMLLGLVCFLVERARIKKRRQARNLDS